ncbi:MauE/DoxX family redox-associated membrane protein [Streptomyces sp. NPDC047082]|uniref:MauE/DoxX family redox-associated membrane protein n=1 Tax=Streptomyces sp. NPDC047082 TaxID=3155259 RepID=UPI0033CD50C5
MPYAESAVRVLIATVFLAAAVGKVRSRRSFAAFTASLGRLDVLPGAVTRATAVAVVVAEWLVCSLVLMPWTRLAGVGLALAAALLVVFSITITCVVARGTRAVCRCFGSGSRDPLGVRHIVRNVLLAGVAACAAGMSLLREAAPVEPWALALSALAGLLVGGCVAAFDMIVELFRPVRPAPSPPSGSPPQPGR